jgi:hypothetical protein
MAEAEEEAEAEKEAEGVLVVTDTLSGRVQPQSGPAAWGHAAYNGWFAGCAFML